MDRPDWKGPLGEALDRALSYLDGLPDRPVPGGVGRTELAAALGGPLPEGPTDPRVKPAARGGVPADRLPQWSVLMFWRS
jgi:hypothetical protein